jgi:hypothetical protein
MGKAILNSLIFFINQSSVKLVRIVINFNMILFSDLEYNRLNPN